MRSSGAYQLLLCVWAEFQRVQRRRGSLLRRSQPQALGKMPSSEMQSAARSGRSSRSLRPNRCATRTRRPATSATSSQPLDTITVTATKTEERAIDALAPVSAVTL